MNSTLQDLVEEKIRDRIFRHNKAISKTITDQEPIRDEEAFIERAMENLVERLVSLACEDTGLDW